MTARHLLLIFELSAGNCVFIDPIHHEYKVWEEKFFRELLVLFFIINSGCCCCAFPLPHLKLIKNLPPSFWYPKEKNFCCILYKHTRTMLLLRALCAYIRNPFRPVVNFSREISLSTTVLFPLQFFQIPQGCWQMKKWVLAHQIVKDKEKI